MEEHFPKYYSSVQCSYVVYVELAKIEIGPGSGIQTYVVES